MTNERKAAIVELIKPWRRLHTFLANSGTDLVGSGERQYYAAEITPLIAAADKTILPLRRVLPQSALHENEQRFHLFSFQAIPMPSKRDGMPQYLDFGPAVSGSGYSQQTIKKPYWVYANEKRLIEPMGIWIERWNRLAETDQGDECDASIVRQPRRDRGGKQRSAERKSEDKRIVAAWHSGQFRDKSALAKAFGITIKRINKAIDAERKSNRSSE